MTELRLVEQQIAVMQPGKIHSPDGIVDCEVLSVSRSGARVRPLGELPELGRLYLAIRGFGQLECRLERTEADAADLVFTGDAQSLDAMFQDMLDRFGDAEGRRRYLRRSVLWPGSLKGDGATVDCTILNMSLGGAKVALAEERSFTGTVTLVGDRFQGLAATIVWKSGRVLGLQFRADTAQVADALGEALPAIKESMLVGAAR
ncbi:PilZ domain-containing protein [Pelagibius sp.]|uniref:PilZ domain-containing protein n=1 Tax=Pelagibius sp. TaxID=1931238 RepID=UPI002611C4CC|nr:PilZ domain-containing protein [Pelagibius sp.]